MELDHIRNAHDSLMALNILLKSDEEIQKGKWLITCLNDAFYGLGISCLTRSDHSFLFHKGREQSDSYIGLLFEDNIGRTYRSSVRQFEEIAKGYFEIHWSEAMPAKKTSPDKTKNLLLNYKLIGFWSMLAMLQSEKRFMNKYAGSKNLALSQKEKKSISYFRDLRNDLIHFIPMSVTIDERSIFDIALDHTTPIKSLIKSNNITPTYLSDRFGYEPILVTVDKLETLITGHLKTLI